MTAPIRRGLRDCLLLIVARAPIAGETKTRLGGTIGMAAAADIHRAFLGDLANRFSPLIGNGRRPYDFGWAFAPPEVDFAATMASIDPRHAERVACYVPQAGDNFAERLLNLFLWAQEHGYQRVQIMASDSPHLPAEIVALGFDLLRDAEVLLGRVEDGGYYVVGMNGVHPVLSPEVMSTPDAAGDLIRAARKQGLRVAETPPSFDVDTAADLETLVRVLEHNPAAAPLSWRAIQRLGLDSRDRVGSSQSRIVRRLPASGDQVGT